MASDSFEEDDIQQILIDIARESGFDKPQFQVAGATKPGDNYLGRVVRAVVQEDGKETLSLIFKIAPPSKVRRELARSGILFRNEANVYNEILPALNNLLRNHGITDSSTYPSTARCLRAKLSEDCSENGIDVLVLEDMKTRGYDTLDRSVGLNAEQCGAVLRRLALLHGSSLGLKHLRPEETQKFESLIQDYWKLDSASLLDDCLGLMQAKTYLVDDRYPIGSPERTKLEDFYKTFKESTAKVFGDSDDTVMSLTHGDCWTNNVLFKQDATGKIEDICLLDFQMPKYASPVADLVYFFFTCTTKETRDAHYESLLRDYHEEVSSILKRLNCDPEEIFPWSTLQEDLKAYGGVALLRAFLAIPFFLAESSEVPQNLDDLPEGSDMKDYMNLFADTKATSRMDECKKRVSDVLLDIIEYGYL